MYRHYLRQFILVLSIFLCTYGISSSSDLSITVWKSPTCGCCQAWVDYLIKNDFNVTTHDVADVVPIKNKLGLTNPELYSCHTAYINGYVIEGHVPISDIEKLLVERPNILGITAPGMPLMSPGMNSITPKNYDVLQFNSKQQSEVFSSY